MAGEHKGELTRYRYELTGTRPPNQCHEREYEFVNLHTGEGDERGRRAGGLKSGQPDEWWVKKDRKWVSEHLYLRGGTVYGESPRLGDVNVAGNCDDGG